MDDKVPEITDTTEDSTGLNKSEDIQAGGVVNAEITDEMQKAYLDYAMSVIVSRALPDVRDGLKPVQRRIVYAMQDQNMHSAGKFHKSAAVVGEVLKRYHPHGDTSVYEAMVRMAQSFSLRYPLVHGQGNFGSVDGDPAAAMRYTESKLQKISDELFKDIGKETVNFYLNDLQNMEPEVLPSLLPNLLLNGASGIAVGMATNIPPHNLGEIIDGLTELVAKAENIGTAPKKEDKGRECKAFDSEEGKFNVKVTDVDFSSNATVDDLMEHIKGPDFPTGGIIYDKKEITQIYATGKGRVVTRAKMDIEEMKNGRMRIVVTEIPYQVNKATLVEKIAHLAKQKKISGISDLRDESNRVGMRVVIELKKDAIPQQVQNRLYKYTPLQQTFNANMVALVGGEPKLLALKTILEEFIKHRQIVIINRAIFLLKRAKAREHILQGLKIALDNLDAVIKLIRGSANAEKAKEGLMKSFKLTSIQAQAILDMQLRKLAALERQKIEDELAEIIGTIGDFEGLLFSPQKIMAVVKKELSYIKEKYADKRNTKVIRGKVGVLADEDLVADEKCIVTISESGYIKRLKEDTYRKQHRGGKGVKGQTLKEDDIVSQISISQTHDYAFFFTNRGKVYKMRVWEIPETSRTAKGTAIVNFLGMGQNEEIQAMFSLDSDALEAGDGYIIFGTEKGKIKKTSLKDYSNIRTSGITAIKLSEGDSLAWVRLSTGKDDIMLITSEGMSIRFKETDVRAMGRVAGGVTGIKLRKENDGVIGMVVLSPKDIKSTLIVVSQKGYGKKTLVSGYKVQNRGGSGIKTYKVTAKTGKLVTARTQSAKRHSDLLIMTSSGNVIRLDTKSVPKLGRDTLGVKLIRISGSDSVASVAKLEEDIEEEIEKVAK